MSATAWARTYAVLCILAGSAAPHLQAQGTAPMTRADSAQAVYRKAQRLVSDGQGAEGRALVDSMLNAADPGAPEEAEALFWRATLAESWEGAQRDYLRIMLEHERSPRAGDAMLRLAQGESARGDREAAIRYLERLVREAPDSPARAEAALWHGRLLIERGDLDGGCSVLRGARARVQAGAIELENQFDYLLRGCATSSSVAASPSPVPAASAPPRAADRDTARSATSTPAPRPPAARPAPTGAPMWSVQAAALTTLGEANALVAKLRARGYDARVDGTTAPFRVRFGLFPTRAAAVEALGRFKIREKSDGFLVEVPRG
jgi:tetratricopeptide (TPR) repeat protein